MEKKSYSTKEVAELLGISRQAVLKKIKSGEIEATKIGRNYVFKKEVLPEFLGGVLSSSQKHNIENVVKKIVDEYGDTLRLLGQE